MSWFQFLLHVGRALLRRAQDGYFYRQDARRAYDGLRLFGAILRFLSCIVDMMHWREWNLAWRSRLPHQISHRRCRGAVWGPKNWKVQTAQGSIAGAGRWWGECIPPCRPLVSTHSLNNFRIWMTHSIPCMIFAKFLVFLVNFRFS